MPEAEWPTVLADDEGICPAGKPDECFHCRQKVGQPHGTRCVLVVKWVRYDALDAGGRRVGTMDYDVPFFWDDHMCEFHKNGSTWCADNAVGRTRWSDEAAEQAATDMASGKFGRCNCGLLTFRLAKVLHPGPLRSGGPPPAEEGQS